MFLKKFLKKLNKQTYLAILLIIVILSSTFVTYNQNKINEEKRQTDELTKKQTITEEENRIKKEIAIESETQYEPKEVPKGGIYDNYSYDYVDNSITGKVIIFFHASWSPNSRNMEGELRENKAKIPKDLTILKADFDSYKNLALGYGVVRPETFVKINGLRELTKITTDLKTLDEVIEFAK